MKTRRRPGNPWAICTAAVGRGNKAKYERCVRSVKARMGMKNPSISAVWNTFRDRQRYAALRAAGVSEDTAKYHAILDWSDLPPESKSALLRGWHMGEVGRTTRRYRDTTRRMPVLTNPIAKPFQVQGSHTYTLSYKGGGWHIYESYGTHADALDMATWLMRRGVAGVKGGVQTLILKPVNERRYSVYYRRSRRVAANGANAMEDRAREVIRKAETALGSLNFNAKVNLLLDNLPLRDSKAAAALLSRLGYRKNGTKGAYPFRDKERQYRKYKMSELLYAREDALKTAKIWDLNDQATANWYYDDYHTICKEIQYRRSLVGAAKFFENSNVPEWLRTREKFFAKFGFSVERFENAIAGLSKAGKLEFHKMIDKGFPEAAVKWAMKHTAKPSVSANKTRHKSKSRRNSGRGYRRFYVARAKRPIGGLYWAVGPTLESMPPSVVGKVFLVSARNRRDAILEVKDPESRWMK